MARKKIVAACAAFSLLLIAGAAVAWRMDAQRTAAVAAVMEANRKAVESIGAKDVQSLSRLSEAVGKIPVGSVPADFRCAWLDYRDAIARGAMTAERRSGLWGALRLAGDWTAGKPFSAVSDLDSVGEDIVNASLRLRRVAERYVVFR